MRREGRGVSSIAFSRSISQELPTTGDKCFELLGRLIGQWTRFWPVHLSELGQDHGVDCIGFGEPVARLGEISHLAGIYHRDG